MGGATDTSNPQAGSMSTIGDYNSMLKSDQQWNTLGSILTKGSSAIGKGIASGSQSPNNQMSPPMAAMQAMDIPVQQQPPTLIQSGTQNDGRLLAILRGMF